MVGDTFVRYHDKICPDGRASELREDNARWLAEREYGLDAVVRVERVRQENPAVALAVAGAARDDDLRPVLMAIASAGGTATYDGVEAFTTVSRRTVKRRVRTLTDDGILEVDTDTKPAVISFTDDAVELLVEDALSLFFTTTTTTKQTKQQNNNIESSSSSAQGGHHDKSCRGSSTSPATGRSNQEASSDD